MTTPTDELKILDKIILGGESENELCVYIHLYYDLLDQFKKYIDRIECDVDIFLSIVHGSPAHVAMDRIASYFSTVSKRVQITLLNNTGSDVVPFVGLNSVGYFSKYKSVCKIHGKKTPRKADLGRWWFETMIEETLLSGLSVVKACLRHDFFPSIVGARSLIITNRLFWSDNINGTSDICKKFGIVLEDGDTPFFFAGTSFWLSQSFLKDIEILGKFPLQKRDITYGADGAFGHAFERAIPYIALKRGQMVLDSCGAAYSYNLLQPNMVHQQFRQAFL